MNETMIVGVTEAPVASRAVEWATARAVERRGKVELLSIVGGALGAVGESELIEDAKARAQEMLDVHAERLRDAGVDVTTRVDSGDPVSLLLAASERASLLVIGSDSPARPDGRGRRGVHGIRIAAGASCPVVVVPDADVRDRRGVVVGVDGSPVSEQALRFAAAEADRLREPLVAVSVWTPLQAPRAGIAAYPELYLTNLQAATEEILALALAGLATDHPDLEVIRRVERGFPSQVLAEQAAAARMVVVGTHGRGALRRFLLGSISHEMLARMATVTAVVR